MMNSKKNYLIFLRLLLAMIVLVGFTHETYADVKSRSLENYYHNVFLGERKTGNYSGALDPRSHFSDTSGSLVYFDDMYRDEYLNEQIQAEPFSLYTFWFNEVVEKSTCPDETLGENIDYIRYLYRLISMSYLFEGLKINHKFTRELGFKNICPIDYKTLFGTCKPESSDMKKFSERVYGKFVNEIEKIKIEALSGKDVQSILKKFQNSTSLTTDPIYSRLHEWCIQNKKSCRQMTLENLNDALASFCQQDSKVITMLCSEKDSLYGLSQAPLAGELIKRSNAFGLINKSGMGEECLRRYSKVFHNKESSRTSLPRQYPVLYSYLQKNNSRYEQGDLFLPGALKEFDMKGLSDFLTALKPPKEEPIVIIKPKAKPKPKPVIVVAKKIEVPVKKLEPAPVIIEAPPEIVISEFEKGANEIVNLGKDSYWINMETFRDDFEFSAEMITELSGPIKKFQTRSALVDMKSYDLLGSKEAPVGLIFLKFLIDTENHQGLYNITTVLGEKFFVQNDIEKIATPHYMQLKNDASTKNRWQIILLKK